MRSDDRSRVSLYSHDGRRKYISPAERPRFLACARQCPAMNIRCFALFVALTGCRLSEALNIRGVDVNLEERFVGIRTLKRRNVVLVREIPLPDDLLQFMADAHTAVREGSEARLWPWSRSYGWRIIKALMLAAGVSAGPHRTAKGLRHGFGIHAIRSGVPLNMVQRWLGHASIATTAIYTDALGCEERELAQRMWGS